MTMTGASRNNARGIAMRCGHDALLLMHNISASVIGVIGGWCSRLC
jgi:hypothetical protein